MQDSLTPPRRSWWAINWKWVVPLGCFGMVVFFVAMGAGIFWIVSKSIKSSWAYSEGTKLAAADSRVLESLGSPVEPGWWFSGSINTTPSTGNADLAIPLSGPNGQGTLYVVAKKVAGEWAFELAEVEIHGTEERIDLLRPASSRVPNTVLQLTVRPVTALAAALGPRQFFFRFGFDQCRGMLVSQGRASPARS